MAKIREMAKVRELTRLEDVDAVMAESQDQPIFVFKHSEICPISHNALDEYCRFVNEYEKDGFAFKLIMIRDYRDVSNAIAAKTGVKHESPQVLLISGGRSIWDDSHFEITAEKLKQVVMMYEDGDFRN